METRTVELTQKEQYDLVMKHVVPDYDTLIDTLKAIIPDASKGKAVLALILARHIEEHYSKLIDQLLDYVVEYAVSAEFTPKTESTK